MPNSRIPQIQAWIKEDPGDPFLRYALAMEYLGTGENDLAKGLFEYLLGQHPDYLPTYYQAGILISGLGDLTRALSILEKGLALAKQRNDQKTANELRELLEYLT